LIVQIFFGIFVSPKSNEIQSLSVFKLQFFNLNTIIMVIPKSVLSNNIAFLLLANLFFISSFSQVGIGTLSPDPSSMLDVASTSQGILTPRMSSAQRLAITDPANGLLVYDLDERAFYFFEENGDKWVRLNSSLEKRENFVLVKSETDFPAPSGGVITLDANTYYEINGTIVLNNTINLNNAYLSGLDANEDRLLRTSGTIFTGSTGGSIRNITLLGGVTAGSGTGTAFNITATTTERLLVQNTIIANMSSVGTISGLGLYFSNIVQYSGNTTGITYNNINSLLLSNQGWFSGNAGTFETFTGSFDLLQKVSGFSTVDATAIGMDVSSNPTVGEGILLSTLFTGAGTYINKYTVGSFTGFNFNNNWVVNCPGLPRESDDVATINIYYDGTITTGFVQTVTNNNEFNLRGNSNSNTTTAVNAFRASSPQDNRLTYNGRRTRTFQINAVLSVRGNSGVGDFYAFFIKKNGTTTLVETNTIMRVNNTSDISSNGISGTVELAPGDYIEIWGQRLVGSGTTSITVFSLNINIK